MVIGTQGKREVKEDMGGVGGKSTQKSTVLGSQEGTASQKLT